jgi:DnaJ-class molecular chaperone
MPVTQVTRYLEHGWFNHAAHREEKCATCHAAGQSTGSDDLLLPDLKSCRTCHFGEGAPRGKISSGCAMCHDFHQDALAPRGLKPRRRS